MSEKQFLVSVADALIIDPDTKSLLVKGKALLNSSIEQTMQSQEIFAGRGSTLQMEFNYQKMLNISIESADFSPAYLAMQTGSVIKNELSKYYTEEDVAFDASGNGTLDKTPIGDVYVEMLNGGNLTVAATGTTVNVPSLSDKVAKVVYQYNTTVDVINIPANSFPKAYELVLSSDIYGSGGNKTHEMQIQVPRYKLDGALTLGLTHDASSTFTLNGKTLADRDNNYAYVKFLPLAQTQVDYIGISTTTADVQLNTGESEQLTVVGIRGGNYANVLNPAGTTFTSDKPAVATVSNTGLISFVGIGNAVVTVENGLHEDKVLVTCV
ncbi:hypothetical protein [Metabacillus fastidiosus]|uniref:hypothetical protein n=1 Tax=Metabacillus fastidiosus TaxID=1458 RepID=UPI003D291A68